METVMVGERGQITIPKRIREKLGIKPKSPVIIEATKEGVLIKPATTVCVREFSDDFIEELIKEDTLKEREREEILSKWKRS